MNDDKQLWKKYGRDTPMFSWKGKCVKARVVDAHDVDTCRVVFQSSPGTYSQFIIRLDGIDGPEISSHDKRETDAAVQARNRLLSLIAPQAFDRHKEYSKKEVLRLLAENPALVYLHLGAQDKYGRTLAHVFATGEAAQSIAINQILIDEGLVHTYSGKTKQPWVWPADVSVV